MIKKTLWLASLSILSIFNSTAQNLNLFPDVVIKGDSYVTDITQTNDGSYLLTGAFDHVDRTHTGNLVKVDYSGNVINSFNQINTNDHILKTVVLPDGKILIGGWFSMVNGEAASLLRLNANGTIDNTFRKFTVYPSFEYVSTFAVQATGKILVTGSFFNGLYHDLIRLNQDGSIDESFVPIGGNLLFGVKLKLDAFDNIFVTDSQQLFKFNRDGGVPISGFPIAVSGYFYELEMFGNKAVIGGSFTSVGGVNRTNVAIINSDGTLDPFNANTPQVNRMALTSDGKVIVNDFTHIYVYNADGTFQSQIVENRPEHIFIDNNNKILITGSSSMTANGTPHPFSIRFNSDLTIDNSFHCEATATIGVTAVESYDRDGRILVGTSGGYLTAGINDVNKRLARINRDGKIDTSFNPVISSEGIHSIAIQGDGKILVCSNQLTRLNASGSIDYTFYPSKADSGSYSYILLSKVKIKDQRVFLSGSFNTIDHHLSPGIVKLKPNGKIDPSFTSGLPSDAYVTDFAFQSNNKIIVAGYFYGYYNPMSKILMRLNADGTIDDSFTNGTALYNGISRLAVDSLDRIYAAGSFYNYNSAGHNALVRISADGIVDNNFNPTLSFGYNPNIQGLEIISQDEIFVGSSTGYTGPSMATYNASGDLLIRDYNSFSDQSSITTSFFNGETLYVGGRLVPADYSAASGVGYANIYTVAGSLTDLQAFWNSPIKSQVSWNNSMTKGTAIIVERSTGNNLNYVPLDTISSTATAYIDSTAVGSSSYYYRVKGINTHSSTDYSNEALLFHLQSQTIDFAALPVRTYGDSLFFSLSATASSALTVTFSSSDPLIASINSNTVTIYKSGTVVITALQTGNAIFDSASVKRTLVINKANQTISFEPIPVKELGIDPFEVSAFASSGLPVGIISSDETIASVNGLTVTIHKSGEVMLTAVQAGNENYYSASPTKQSLKIIPVTCNVANVYPNPGKGVFEVQLGSGTHDGFYSVISPDGIAQGRRSLKLNSQGVLLIDLTNDKAGVYHIRIEGRDHDKINLRVVKE